MFLYKMQPIYKFYRKRLGNKTTTPNGDKYGPYLYRNTTDNTLLASWDKPTKESNYMYKGEDIGYNTDALFYYKNT
jgi:hypothetical protein